MNFLTFTELYSGWTEDRAIWNKSADAVLAQVKELEAVVPYALKKSIEAKLKKFFTALGHLDRESTRRRIGQS